MPPNDQSEKKMLIYCMHIVVADPVNSHQEITQSLTDLISPSRKY